MSHSNFISVEPKLPDFLAFHRRDLCEARSKSVFKFSDVLFPLKSDIPPIDEALGQVDIFCQIFGSG